MALLEVKIKLRDPGTLGGLLAALKGSLALLLGSWRAPGAGLEASWAQIALIWWALFVSLLEIFFETGFEHVFC